MQLDTPFINGKVSIERCNWFFDVAFHEGNCRMRKGEAAQNLSAPSSCFRPCVPPCFTRRLAYVVVANKLAVAQTIERLPPESTLIN